MEAWDPAGLVVVHQPRVDSRPQGSGQPHSPSRKPFAHDAACIGRQRASRACDGIGRPRPRPVTAAADSGTASTAPPGRAQRSAREAPSGCERRLSCSALAGPTGRRRRCAAPAGRWVMPGRGRVRLRRGHIEAAGLVPCSLRD